MSTCYQAINIPGPQGEKGETGATGAVGATGDIGPDGATGAPGAAGAPGVDGLDGIDAFTVTTASFTQPAEGATVTVSVGTGAWVGVGQHILVTGGGDYEAVGLVGSTSITLRNLENTAGGLYPGNAAPGAVIGSGAKVSPGGIQGPIGVTGASASLLQVTLSDQVASAGAAQAIAFGAWTTKRLQSNNPSTGGALVSLVGNQFILATGTYLVNGFIFTEQAYARLRIQDVTTPLTLLRGVNMANLNNSGGIVPINGRIVTTSAKTLELQYWAQDNGGATVLGIPMTPNDPASPEIYAAIDFLKIA